MKIGAMKIDTIAMKTVAIKTCILRIRAKIFPRGRVPRLVPPRPIFPPSASAKNIPQEIPANPPFSLPRRFRGASWPWRYCW
jgi:hypothetical protein